MLAVILTAIIAFILGVVATVIKTNNSVSHIVNSAQEKMDERYKLGHRDGWHAALEERLLIASKYHEYYPSADKK